MSVRNNSESSEENLKEITQNMHRILNESVTAKKQEELEANHVTYSFQQNLEVN